MHFLSKREFNTHLLVNLINKYGPISRTKLCEITELRAASISDITKELLESGIILEKGSTNSGRGRNQILLELNDEYLCAIGVSVEADEVTFVLATLRGKILKKINRDITAFTESKQITDMMVDVLKEMLKEFSNKMILGVGIGDPGIVDIKGEYSLFSSQLKVWANIPLKLILEKELKLPVKLETNDRLKALGEKKYGLARDCDNFVCVQLGNGIAVSMILGGELIKGHNGAAGEMGHVRVSDSQDSENICMCGNYGCLEVYASLHSVISMIKEATKRGVASAVREICGDIDNLTFEEVKKAVEINDKLCINVVETAGRYIGTALSCVVNVVNPKLVIFNGVMCEFGEAFLGSIKSTIYRESLSYAISELEFKTSELMELSAPLGATTMIFADYLQEKLFNHYDIWDDFEKE